MFSNGKTAMEAFSDNGADGVHDIQTPKPAKSTSKTAAMEAARDSVGGLAGLGCNSALRQIQGSI